LPLVFNNKRSNARIFASLVLSMTLIGLWHGAGWNWLIFGLMHGFYVGIHRIVRNYIPMLKIRTFFKTKIGTVIAIFVTQYLVFLSFIVFRVRDLDAMWYSVTKFILLDFQTNDTISIIMSNKLSVLLIALFIILHYISYRKKNLPEIISSFKWTHWILFLLTVTLVILFFYDSNPRQFFYFQF
jgi:D-alanyl-lipoteichoic acid acyltransferase DltB (MBOAT superfamily)